jgi:hypothetical protein
VKQVKIVITSDVPLESPQEFVIGLIQGLEANYQMGGVCEEHEEVNIEVIFGDITETSEL